MSANAWRIDVCSWRWAEVDKMTVGVITLSQRWPTVGKYMEDKRLYLTVGWLENTTVGFPTCSQRWPNVAYATATMPTIANIGPTSAC